jgi:phosphate transport system permease protein
MFDRRLRRKIVNALFIVFCSAAAALALFALAAILVSLLINGASGFNLAVFTQDTPAPGSPGGLRNAIIGSLMLCGLAMVLAVVVGILAGTWLAEYADRTPLSKAYGSVVRFVNDVLLSAPSILVGLFIYYLLVAHTIGHFSGWAGAVALALLAAPVVVRTTEDVMRLQSRQLRESGIALGAPLWTTINQVLWRAAGGGIITGALLAFARISGETAPLLFTSLNNQFFSLNLGQSISSLPVVIFNFALSAYDDWRRLAWVGSLLIAGAVLFINILVRVLSKEPRR